MSSMPPPVDQMNQCMRRSVREKNTSAQCRMFAKANISAPLGPTSQLPSPKPTLGSNTTRTMIPSSSSKHWKKFRALHGKRCWSDPRRQRQLRRRPHLAMLLEDGVHREEPTQVQVPTYWLRGKKNRSPRQDRAKCNLWRRQHPKNRP